MIEQVLIGDLFEAQAQTLVNTVNCVGVMGKGLALAFKKRFPEMYADYQERCSRKQVRLGEPYLYRSLFPPYILNFPTKDHWRSVSRLEDIERGLDYLRAHYEDWGITSMAVPPLGCGNGGLDWKDVGPLLAKSFQAFDIPIILFAPEGTPSEWLSLDTLLGKGPVKQPELPKDIQPGWIAVVEILNRIHSTPFHWPVGRVIFQKIAYFSTGVGIPTGLVYRRGSYGPFSEGLKPALTTLINKGLIIERQRGQMFSVEIGPAYPQIRELYADELEQWDQWIELAG